MPHEVNINLLVTERLSDALRRRNPRHSVVVEDDPKGFRSGRPERRVRVRRPYDEVLVHVTDGGIMIEKERDSDCRTLGKFELSDPDFWGQVADVFRGLGIRLPDSW